MILNRPESPPKPARLASIIEPIQGVHLLQKVKSFIYIPMLAAVPDAPSNWSVSHDQAQKQTSQPFWSQPTLSNCQMISINPGGAHGRLG